MLGEGWIWKGVSSVGRRNLVFLLSLRIKSQRISRQRYNQAAFCFVFFFGAQLCSSSGTGLRLFYSKRPLVTASSWPFPGHHSCLLEGTLCCPILFPRLSWLKSLCRFSVADRLRERERDPENVKESGLLGPVSKFRSP